MQTPSVGLAIPAILQKTSANNPQQLGTQTRVAAKGRVSSAQQTSSSFFFLFFWLLLGKESSAGVAEVVKWEMFMYEGERRRRRE